jgi:hypothetical protein
MPPCPSQLTRQLLLLPHRLAPISVRRTSKSCYIRARRSNAVKRYVMMDEPRGGKRHGARRQGKVKETNDSSKCWTRQVASRSRNVLGACPAQLLSIHPFLLGIFTHNATNYKKGKVRGRRRERQTRCRVGRSSELGRLYVLRGMRKGKKAIDTYGNNQFRCRAQGMVPEWK